MGQIDVSVLVTLYNKAPFLSAALKSIDAQQGDFVLEVVIVDDGSTDGGDLIAERFCSGRENFHFFRNEINSGIGYSLRKAYNMARGEFVTVLDADDFWLGTSKISDQITFLRENPPYFAIGHNSFVIYPENAGFSLLNLELDSRSYSYAASLRGDFYLHTSSLMFRREPAGLPREFENRVLDGDTPFFLWHLLQSKKMVRSLPGVFSAYRLTLQGWWVSQDASMQQSTNANLISAIRRNFIQPHQLRERAIIWRRMKSIQGAPSQSILSTPVLYRFHNNAGEEGGPMQARSEAISFAAPGFEKSLHELETVLFGDTRAESEMGG